MKKIINYEYKSKLSPYIRAFVNEKRASGYLYNNEAKFLYAFDKWLIADPKRDCGELSKEVVLGWFEPHQRELHNSRKYRTDVVILLARYMVSLGKDAFIARRLKKQPRELPYIPSTKELSDFFSFIDTTYTQSILAKRKHHSATYAMSKYFEVMIVQVLLRFYVTTGLRLNEAVNLKLANFNMDTGKIYIDESKGDKHRYIIISNSMLSLIKRMLKRFEELKLFSEWLFPNPRRPELPYPGTKISAHMRKAWQQCFPDSINTGNRPTIHELRHTFVVYRVTKWCLDDAPVNKLMPYLSAHLGHVSVNETYNYFHQIEHLVPAVRAFMNTNFIFNKESYEYREEQNC